MRFWQVGNTYFFNQKRADYKRKTLFQKDTFRAEREKVGRVVFRDKDYHAKRTLKTCTLRANFTIVADR